MYYCLQDIFSHGTILQFIPRKIFHLKTLGFSEKTNKQTKAKNFKEISTDLPQNILVLMRSAVIVFFLKKYCLYKFITFLLCFLDSS